MNIKQAIEMVEKMGYTAKQSELDYVVGEREGMYQWFKVMNGKLHKRVDYHAGKFEWEVVG
ncbi:hypothetical protein [Jeotgalibaca porci]|uniref:hypothetical protein n=1 Tax=Jeotgalibaca porci TaxID=1868793 RepID=UPI0035A13B4E